METIFNLVDESLVNYWKLYNLTEQDFYCRECGECMLDIEDAKNVRYITVGKRKTKKPIKPYLYDVVKDKLYVETEQNRWLVAGRTLSGKVYFRHICWKCFFKKLKETTDIARRARKSSWYTKILNGTDAIPPAWASPSHYYKFVFDITDDELSAERAKFDTASLDSFIHRFGEEQGKIKFEEYKNRQAYTCSKEYMMNEKGMSEEDWNNFNASRASTKENFIKRYGKELGEEKWNDYCSNESYAGCALEYFIEKYGKEQGEFEYLRVNASKAITLDNFIKKYGLDEGKKRFELVRNKAYSKISQILFKQIDKKLGEYSANSKYAEKNFEQVINIFFDDGKCKACRPDYILNTKIIEFNGDFWHANPKYYGPNDTPDRKKHDKASDIWQADALRKEALEKLGYKVKVVWESDFYENPDKVINDCVQFLKS